MSAPTLQLRLDDAAKLLALRLRDMPYGGLFVPLDAGGAAASPYPIEPGEPLIVVIEVRGLPPVRLAGAVLWCRRAEAAGEGRPGVGLGLFPNYAHLFEDLLDRCQSAQVYSPLRGDRRHSTVISARPVHAHAPLVEVRDLSRSGMCIVGGPAPAPGTRGRWALQLAGEQVVVEGEVKWARTDLDPPRYGIRFLFEPESSSEEALLRYVGELEAASDSESKGSASISMSLRRVR
ncbi:MAG: hypothetical protein D6729_04875 [Deltaproteobacteria bacterium]|nr:MAG: hypothetical protein D6729_04875 [Deltaproteobacteria bacterium]